MVALCRTKAKGSDQGQGGMVLLSVIGLLLVLSVLASSAGRQMHWSLQTAAESMTYARDQSRHRVLISILHGVDVGMLTADIDSGTCHRIAPDACVRFYPQRTSGTVWRFALMLQHSEGAQSLLLEGWLGRRIEAPQEVAALWFAKQPSQ